MWNTGLEANDGIALLFHKPFLGKAQIIGSLKYVLLPTKM